MPARRPARTARSTGQPGARGARVPDASAPRTAPARPRGAGGGAASADDTADRLHSAAIHLLRRLRREDDASGLPGPRLSALSVVVYRGPITLGELAAAEQVRPPTMTRVVGALERDGLVRRERDARDGRVVRLRATAAGARVLERGRARRIAALARELAALPRAELAALQGALDVLERVVGAKARWQTRDV